MRKLALTMSIRAFSFHKVLQFVSKCRHFSSGLPSYPGARTSWTETIKFTTASSYEIIPTYRVMDNDGKIIKSSEDPKLSAQIVVKMYKDMVTLNVMDKIMFNLREKMDSAFHAPGFGEEATHIGSTAALELTDYIYGQYREPGTLMWRGFQIIDFMNQWFCNVDDLSCGKNLQVHYGSKKLNVFTFSSPIGTQIPQAAGAAYAVKGSNRVVLCFFGEGAASTGDTHAAMNFAATLNCPVIFFCRNNGYQSSTPSNEQYKSDGIAVRGPGYGMNTLRCDGNDIFAVYNATKRAKEYALQECEPVLIEALTYRIGAHTTLDDGRIYRNEDEVHYFLKNSPINKLKRYLILNGLWNEEKDLSFHKECQQSIVEASKKASSKLKPKWTKMFEHVYAEIPLHIGEQMESMENHVEKYKDKYPLEIFTQ